MKLKYATLLLILLFSKSLYSSDIDYRRVSIITKCDKLNEEKGLLESFILYSSNSNNLALNKKSDYMSIVKDYLTLHDENTDVQITNYKNRKANIGNYGECYIADFKLKKFHNLQNHIYIIYNSKRNEFYILNFEMLKIIKGNVVLHFNCRGKKSKYSLSYSDLESTFILEEIGSE